MAVNSSTHAPEVEPARAQAVLPQKLSGCCFRAPSFTVMDLNTSLLKMTALKMFCFFS